MPSSSATTDKRTDAYIGKSAAFAKPILEHLRTLVHDACPEVQETIKWSFPHFLYKNKILCSMAAFKQHCAFHIWRGGQIIDPEKNKSDEAMGQFGRITSVGDLPPKRTIAGCLKQSMKMIDDKPKTPAAPKAPREKKALVIPDYFTAVLKKNKKAQTTFDAFSYTNKKDYVEWITEAKSEETRQKRMATALEWMAEGKSRNWKYEKR